MKSFLLLFLFFGFFNQKSFSENTHEIPQPMSGLHLNDLRLLPVQSGGRIKPFDEFARETVLSLTGTRSFDRFDPSEMILSMMVHPHLWSEMPIIRISIEDVRKQLLLNPERKYFSPAELMKNNSFLQYAQGLQTGGQQVTSTGIDTVTGNHDPRAEELKRVVDRMSRFQALVSGKLWAVSPPKSGAEGGVESAWLMLDEGMKNPTPQSTAVYGILKSYLDKDVKRFQEATHEARTSLSQAIPGFEAISPKLTAEVFYNRLRPFLQAMIFYLVAGILWMFADAYTFPRLIAKFLTCAAFLVHVIGISLRCYVAGRPPVTNMYESIVWVSLGVMIFAVLLFIKNKQTILMTTSTILAGLALFSADSAPLIMDPTIRPLVPVLRSNYWLTIHVLTITLSYGAFMLAMGISNSTLYFFRKKMKADLPAINQRITQKITTLNQLSYRALMFGTVLLAAGTILGGIWADYSWGRFWGWDPKEVWALIALLSYMAVIHGRLSGWVGTFAFPLWTVICFSTVLMAWYGVNFVLGVGLHSYGFSSGGQSAVASFLILQAIYCAYIAYEYKKYKSAH